MRDNPPQRAALPGSDERSPAQVSGPIPVPAPEADAAGSARQQRLAKLKQSIADGTYSISAGQLADKIVSDLLQPQTPTGRRGRSKL